ncbi:tail fiber assembly protein [Escherichia coli]|nr:tail fiber assembly protein [Escherichia coli]
MNAKYFSAAENAFYASELRDDYAAAGTWPADAIAVSDVVYATFIAEPPEGKFRGVDDSGLPCWLDIPPPSAEEVIMAAEGERQRLIDDANNFINSRQWPGKAAIGRLKGDDLISFNLWLDYLDALEALDISTAPAITWPEAPAV